MAPIDKLEEIRFPIGRLTIDPDVTESKRNLWIAQIAALPAKLRAAVDGLSEAQLNQPYRPEGWRARQVVHYIHRRGRISIDDGIQLYAWHSLHHTAHITGLREREGR
jgi:hypothetical protein